MSANVTPSPSNADELLVRLGKRYKRLLIFALILAFLVVVGTATGFFVFGRKLKALEKSQRDLAFNQFIAETVAAQDFVQPTVNEIQFLHRGYSISFDKVEYNQNGLLLSGQIGNPRYRSSHFIAHSTAGANERSATNPHRATQSAATRA